MSGVRVGSRLQQLERLRSRLDVEIQLERRAQAAAAAAAAVRAQRKPTVAAILAELGVTAHDVKLWALDRGLIPAVARGRVARDLVDAYVKARGGGES